MLSTKNYVLIGLALILLAAIFYVNQALLKELGDTPVPAHAQSVQELPPQPVVPVKKEKKKYSHGYTERVLLDPGRRYSYHFIYEDGEEAARFKTSDDQIFDVTGKIPDGRVSFVNETTKTRGTEHFKKGRRQGAYKEYLEDGTLYKDIWYAEGKPLVIKEYYDNGQLRMEADRTDALWDVSDPELGTGKIYTKRGILKYEWHMTNKDESRFKKSYNIKGDLVEVRYFDRMGNQLRKETYPPK